MDEPPVRLGLSHRQRPKTFDQLINLRDLLSTSLWFVPAVLIVLAMLAALALRVVDAALNRAGVTVPFVYAGTSTDASELLSTLLSSLITMVSLVFSMTLIVLTLAANQFGPRIIRTFMADRGTQFVLGIFVAAIVLCLLVLVQIREGAPVPQFSVTAGILLSFGSVLLLVFFIHSLARSIVAETIIERVGGELDEAIERLLPLDSGAAGARERVQDVLPRDFAERSESVALRRSGYVQAVEYEELVTFAAEHDVILVLRFRAGDYVIDNSRRIFVYPPGECADTIEGVVDSALLIGQHRTPTQDIEFSIRHLVEMAIRALSPSLNDAYTAMAVIDRLGASLAQLMRQELQPETYRDDQGRVRVIGDAPTYVGIFGAAFHQIRQSGRAMPAVTIRLLNTIARIAEHVRLEEQREVLLHHVGMIADDGVRHAGNSRDAADIRETQKAVERVLRTAPDLPQEEKAKAEWFP